RTHRDEGLQAAQWPPVSLLPDSNAVSAEEHEETSLEECRRHVFQQRGPRVGAGYGWLLRHCGAEHPPRPLRAVTAEVPRHAVEQSGKEQRVASLSEQVIAGSARPTRQ